MRRRKLWKNVEWLAWRVGGSGGGGWIGRCMEFAVEFRASELEFITVIFTIYSLNMDEL